MSTGTRNWKERTREGRREFRRDGREDEAGDESGRQRKHIGVKKGENVRKHSQERGTDGKESTSTRRERGTGKRMKVERQRRRILPLNAAYT